MWFIQQSRRTRPYTECKYARKGLISLRRYVEAGGTRVPERFLQREREKRHSAASFLQRLAELATPSWQITDCVGPHEANDVRCRRTCHHGHGHGHGRRYEHPLTACQK